MPYQVMTMDYLLDLIQNASTGPRPQRFCFILGAGASVESGIKTGEELVEVWDGALRKTLTGKQYSDWTQGLGITTVNRKEFYSEYYTKRFEDDPNTARNFMETLIDGFEPSCGFVVLSHILNCKEYQNNIVITTNFDHLCEDAVNYYAHQMPLVLGHEALADHFSIQLKRPIIIKLHRDVLLNPRSTTDDLKKLHIRWKKVLDGIFRSCHPVFIGYAGNDPSFMDYLCASTAKFKNKVYEKPIWLLYRSDTPSGKVEQFLNSSNGICISHDGFDGTMIRLGASLGYVSPTEDVFLAGPKKRYKHLKEALDKYDEEQKKREQERLSQPNDSSRAIEEIHISEALDTVLGTANDITPQRLLRGIWQVSYNDQLKILENAMIKLPQNAQILGVYALVEKEQGHFMKTESLFLKSIETDSRNAINLGNYASFLYEVHKNFIKAEEFYKLALEVDPNNASNLGNYANFLSEVRKDYDSAEEFYKRALVADPKYANNLGNYANFLRKVRYDYDTAQDYYERALGIDPKNAIYLGNYASFLCDIRKDYDVAEVYFKRALYADPKHANTLSNYASFLCDVRKDYDAAEEYYKRALAADSKNANTLGNYANFLCKVRDDYDTAEKYYIRALDADPKHAINLGNYASFLCDIRKDYKAEEYYKRALDADPKHAISLGNYANFLWDVRKNYAAAESYYKRALDADPMNADLLCFYANFLYIIRKDYDTAEDYYKRALNADPNNTYNLGSYAVFLNEVRKDNTAAEEYYKKALETDPKHVDTLGNYAELLWLVRKDYDTAESYYKRTFEIDPKHAYHLGMYAKFLYEVRKDFDTSEAYFKSALEAEPQNVDNLRSYADFLKNIRKDSVKAEEYYKRANETEQQNNTKPPSTPVDDKPNP